jgi:mxaA protein
MRALFVVLMLAAGSAMAQTPAVQIDEPRAYGHVLGDLIKRDVHITLPPGRTLAPQALPRPGRVDAWLDLHSVTLAPRDAAAGATVTLRLNYQVVNIGPKVTTTVLPALRLPLAGGAAAESVEVDDWPVQLAPMTAAVAVSRAGLEAMQPDIVPSREPIAPIAWRLAACAVFGLLLAAPMLLRRYPQLALWRRHAPLRAAWIDVKALHARARRETSQHDALLRDAVARLHAGFDASAGRAVFAASRQLFFAEAAAPLTFDSVQALGLRLARLESQAR